MTPPRVTILNGTFDAIDSQQTVDAVFEKLSLGRRGWLCTVNVATLMAMRTDARLRSFVERAAMVVADGQPLVWCAPLFGGQLPERVAGIELIDALCSRASREGRGVYLLGATTPLIERSMQALVKLHPGLRVDCADGYFSGEASAARADRIRESGASLLLVGMGSPRQERFIDEHWESLGVNVAIGVGGSFDVLGGARARAPRWVARIGFEWLVRLAQEPVRLLPRYLATNTRFCLLIAQTMLARMRAKLFTR